MRRRRKRISALLWAALAALALGGCGGGSRPVELTVFAAASMQETLTELARRYQAVAPEVTLVYNFDSSGTLRTQIAEGAQCDLFISAAPKQMDQLDITADPAVNAEGLDFVLSDTRCDLLENKVVLAVPKGNPRSVDSFADLAAELTAGRVLLAMGNSDVPVGQYTQKIFDYFHLDEGTLEAKGVLTYGSNVKEVVTQVAEAAADCGVVYATDAFSAALTVVDEASPEMCGRVVYPAAVLKTARHEAEARAFLEYLKSEEAAGVFRSVGFTPLWTAGI